MTMDAVRRFRRAIAGLSILLLLPVFAAAASKPPRYRFSTFESGKVRVHFHREVEGPARRVMSLALEILPRLEADYRVAVPALDVVVHDASDSPNGLASVFPYPFVEIRAASIDGAESGPTESWLRMVVTHELAHIVHLEQAGGIYRFGRRVFGRAPFLFPNALQPAWFIEGLAVLEETRGSVYGRGRHAFTKMVVDEAARSGQLERLDQATLGLDVWPRGNAAYLFGEEFLQYLERRFGAGASRSLAAAHARKFRPFLDQGTFREVTKNSLSDLWRDFSAERAGALSVPAPLKRLTTRGFLQTSPRLSPDGGTIAYTSHAPDRLGEIRLMTAAGTADRKLTRRLSSGALSWSRDGASIVFDETDSVRRFETRSDLHRVDTRTGRRERLTRGLRASEPDYGPGPASQAEVVFVRRYPDRSELAVREPGGRVRDVTASAPGTEWSRPRFSPLGDSVVAACQTRDHLDIVLVDPRSGVVTKLTNDRAADAEPAWWDEETIVFRSDRQGSFRLYTVDRGSGRIQSLGGEIVFSPEPDPARERILVAAYSSRGFDIAVLPQAAGDTIEPFHDTLPELVDDPPPFDGPARSYSIGRTLVPRFVSPYVERPADEWRLGLATAAFDPLARTAYGVAASIGTTRGDANGLAYLRYDRFMPTFSALVRSQASPDGDRSRRETEGWVSMDLPIERSLLRSQTFEATVRRRREELGQGNLDTAVVAGAWLLDTTRRYPMSISPQDGVRVRLAFTRESQALGSDLDFGKVVGDARAYASLGRTVLASRLVAGWTYGPAIPRTAFAVGGLASPSLLDPVGDEPALLRGYDRASAGDTDRFGRRLAGANLELRVPLGHPQRGVRALPVFLRHLHLAAGVDAAWIGEGRLRWDAARVSGSLGLGADLLVGHRLPVTITFGLGRGFTRDGVTTPWFALGLPF